MNQCVPFSLLNKIPCFRHLRLLLPLLSHCLESSLGTPDEKMILAFLVWWHFGFWSSSSICLLLFAFQAAAVLFYPGVVRAIYGRVQGESVFSILPRMEFPLSEGSVFPDPYNWPILSLWKPIGSSHGPSGTQYLEISRWLSLVYFHPPCWVLGGLFHLGNSCRPVLGKLLE